MLTGRPSARFTNYITNQAKFKKTVDWLLLDLGDEVVVDVWALVDDVIAASELKNAGVVPEGDVAPGEEQAYRKQLYRAVNEYLPQCSVVRTAFVTKL